MPTLSYTSSNYPFQPYTKVYSADINTCLADITTFINTTKLDSNNIQTSGIATSNLASSSVTYAKLDTSTVVPLLVPTGTILDFGGTSVPTGYLACDGSAVSRSTYSALFTALGTTWGAGDGSTTFNVPNLARRVTVGSGGSGTGTLGNAVGNTGGEETHTLTTSEMPSHTHVGLTGSLGNWGVAGGSDYGGSVNLMNTAASADGYRLTTASAGSGGAHNVMQPSAVVKKIIKT